QLARHTRRPDTVDLFRLLLEDFVELHGDPVFGDDKAIVGGLARFEGEPVVVIGHQKGRDTRENIARNFGMPHPEGYRKGLRLMGSRGKFGKPLLTFIDTPGAYPGLGAEERGQAEAIARNLREMAGLATPIVCVVTGEGGSGGALAIGMGNRVLMLEYGVYSVISPEGCAAILWGEATKAPEAAELMRVTAPELKSLAGLLRDERYELTETAQDADLILLNTCAIREKCEDKVFSRLGELKHLKRERPHVLIGVMGCMAQLWQGKIQERAPSVDLVFGS